MTYSIKVYKIVNNIDDRIYIGSTKNLLRKRFSGHIKTYNTYCLKSDSTNKLGRLSSYTLFEDYGVYNCEIVLLEEFQVHSKEQQLKHEREYYDKLKEFAVNVHKPSVSREEYLAYQKQYKILNPVIVHAQNVQRSINQKVRYMCPDCGKQMPRGSKSQHQRSQGHVYACDIQSRINKFL